MGSTNPKVTTLIMVSTRGLLATGLPSTPTLHPQPSTLNPQPEPWTPHLLAAMIVPSARVR
ncbi:hypothetical protein T484DRAFT_2279525 [Baffinella frigidus]|nr:hypothetical protein T484DRAFT_2279525 [Cryptophyta sp. CCMP2293]